jgi:hypothetical protein
MDSSNKTSRSIGGKYKRNDQDDRIKIVVMKEILKDLEHFCLHLEAKTTALNLRALIENGIHENIVSSIGGRVL